MVEETDEDRADRERLFDALERSFWRQAAQDIFGVRDSDTRPKDGDAKQGSTRE